jgi:SAM-dependent methyltransferase
MADRLREACCVLCGAGQARHLVTKRGYEVVRCAACGLVFVWPQPTRQEMEALYGSGGYHAEVDEAERRRTFARRLRQIEGLEPRRGRILDVGCSKGYFLDVARAEGWDAVGVELNAHAVDAARARGLDVRQGDLADEPFEEGSFDVVTLFDLLEHTADPQATLGACRRVLRPGGLLVVTTPNIDGLVPRVTWWLFARTLGAWDHPTPPWHLVQFSRRTLRRALEGSGFEVVALRSEHIPVGYSVGKLENSVMDVLAGRHRTRPKPSASSALGCLEAAPEPRRTPPVRRLGRPAVRAVAWLVIGAAGLVGRLLGWGDSMAVAARRRE